MRISKLHLTNFRSFAETQIIEFAQVTFLFGPNSVGKSTVLMALFYLQQVLSKGQCDPLRIEALGDKYIGGFKNLVNGRDLNKNIIIKVEYTKSDDIGSSYAYLTNLMSDHIDLQLGSPTADAEEVAIELTISWSVSEKTAYVSSYKLWLDGEYIAESTSDAGLKQPMITGLNYLHPFLLPENHDDWLVACFDQELAIHTDLMNKLFALKGLGILTERETDNSIEDVVYDESDAMYFTDDCFVSEFHELINDDRIPSAEYNNSSYMTVMGNGESTLLHAPIGFKGMSGALPLLGKPLSISIDIDSEPDNHVINEVLSDVLVAPLDNLLLILNRSLCIGPLRVIQDPTYQANPYPQQKDWYSGLAAWDVLEKADIRLLHSVDDWMSSKDKLDLGYGLVIKVEKSFSEFKPVGSQTDYSKAEQQLERMITSSKSFSDKKIDFDQNSTKYTYSIWDVANQIDVYPSDIGVGISQLMPLIVAAMKSNKGVVAIEQPELHVHPRVQVAVGDLLTQIESDTNFLVETHSEHLILRILKRIRQSTDNELPAGYKAVKPEDVSIVYLESSGKGVKTKKIEIDEDGEFVGRWPDGFFAERRGELM